MFPTAKKQYLCHVYVSFSVLHVNNFEVKLSKIIWNKNEPETRIKNQFSTEQKSEEKLL